MEKYNGWTNWETWSYNLIYSDYWQEYANENNITDTNFLVELMKDQVDVDYSEIQNSNSFFEQLLTGTISEINFYEVAKHITDEVSV
jgi:hypothetical protein